MDINSCLAERAGWVCQIVPKVSHFTAAVNASGTTENEIYRILTLNLSEVSFPCAASSLESVLYSDKTAAIKEVLGVYLDNSTHVRPQDVMSEIGAWLLARETSPCKDLA